MRKLKYREVTYLPKDMQQYVVEVGPKSILFIHFLISFKNFVWGLNFFWADTLSETKVFGQSLHLLK